MNYIDEARRLRPIIERAAQSLEDTEALDAVALFPAWSGEGMNCKAGMRLRYDGALYKVRQEHTSQADWPPDLTPALFERVCEDETAGTLNNPIPYAPGMALEQGKYYEQGGIKYLCNRDTGIPVYHALADLVGLYVEIAPGS